MFCRYGKTAARGIAAPKARVCRTKKRESSSLFGVPLSKISIKPLWRRLIFGCNLLSAACIMTLSSSSSIFSYTVNFLPISDSLHSSSVIRFLVASCRALCSLLSTSKINGISSSSVEPCLEFKLNRIRFERGSISKISVQTMIFLYFDSQCHAEFHCIVLKISDMCIATPHSCSQFSCWALQYKITVLFA